MPRCSHFQSICYAIRLPKILCVLFIQVWMSHFMNEYCKATIVVKLKSITLNFVHSQEICNQRKPYYYLSHIGYLYQRLTSNSVSLFFLEIQNIYVIINRHEFSTLIFFELNGINSHTLKMLKFALSKGTFSTPFIFLRIL